MDALACPPLSSWILSIAASEQASHQLVARVGPSVPPSLVWPPAAAEANNDDDRHSSFVVRRASPPHS